MSRVEFYTVKHNGDIVYYGEDFSGIGLQHLIYNTMFKEWKYDRLYKYSFSEEFCNSWSYKEFMMEPINPIRREHHRIAMAISVGAFTEVKNIERLRDALKMLYEEIPEHDWVGRKETLIQCGNKIVEMKETEDDIIGIMFSNSTADLWQPEIERYVKPLDDESYRKIITYKKRPNLYDYMKSGELLMMSDVINLRQLTIGSKYTVTEIFEGMPLILSENYEYDDEDYELWETWNEEIPLDNGDIITYTKNDGYYESPNYESQVKNEFFKINDNEGVLIPNYKGRAYRSFLKPC